MSVRNNVPLLSDGVLYLWNKIKGAFVQKETGKGLSTNDYTTAEKSKLAGIEENANNYSLPKASATTLGGIKVGNNLTIDGDGVLSAEDSYVLPTASADTKGGVKIGSNLTMNGEVLSAVDTTYGEATTTEAGLMSAADKTKIDGIAVGANKTIVDATITSSSTNPVQSAAVYTALAGKVDVVDGKGLSTNDYTTAEKTKLAGIEANANNYSLPTASAEVKGGVKIGANLTMAGEVLSAVDTTYDEASTTEAGLMSAADKVKIDGIAAGANRTVVDSAMSDTSTNPVQNAVIYSALDGKVDKETGKGLSTNDYTTTEKTKLAGIEANANNYTLPTASTTLGGVRTTSSVSDVTGYVATPIVSGVAYYHDTTYSEANSSAAGLMSATDKAKLDAFGASSTYALKSDIERVYKIKSSVATVADLPTTGNDEGDARNVLATSMNYVWIIDTDHPTGYWDEFGATVAMDGLTNAEIDELCTL